MKLLIDIPEHIYEHAKETTEDSNDEFDAMRAIANGTQQESRSEIPNTCEDAISRQATVERLCRVADFMNEKRRGLGLPYVMAALFIQDNKDEFPPVTPQPKIGRWIYGEDNLGTGRDGWYCNQCGHFEFWDYSSNMKSAILNLPNPCPNCGARMEVEE